MPSETILNFKEPVKTVRHADLKRAARGEGHYPYRSECPVCENGVLLVYRHPLTFRLLSEDRCISCGQAFVYEDIEEMRKADGVRDPLSKREKED